MFDKRMLYEYNINRVTLVNIRTIVLSKIFTLARTWLTLALVMIFFYWNAACSSQKNEIKKKQKKPDKVKLRKIE